MISDLDLHLVEQHAAFLSKDSALKPVADAMTAEALRKVAHAIREMLRVSPAEERAAWDQYAAVEGSQRADKLLAERRERFGGAR